MGKRTPLYDKHLSLNAKMVDFSGWTMPVHYGSQLDEHHAVRSHAGVFDVSHMTPVEVVGAGAKDYFDRLLANDIGRLKLKGQAMYSAMLNQDGCVLDDLIVYDNHDGHFLAVVNCATREKDLAWMRSQAAPFDCQITERQALAILAIQGPQAMAMTQALLTPSRQAAAAALKAFQGVWADGWFIARTGYTGERGYEILLPGEAAPAFFTTLVDSGVRPIGLGARDTLRLEAGMNLYGNDMDESVTPFEANMAATVQLEGRDFIGAQALRQLQGTTHPALTGIVLQGRGVLRAGYAVFPQGAAAPEEGAQADEAGKASETGIVTSGAFSPTLGCAIGLARVGFKVQQGDQLTVAIRGKMHPAIAVNPPFVRNGKQVYSTDRIQT